mmetsp:Transcript_40223/g.52704  ORF Transcript_40223/g.52704 Transcript_40223/m.52704 type:complete len:211 (-) Transcript_40223:651-1283(-)
MFSLAPNASIDDIVPIDLSWRPLFHFFAFFLRRQDRRHPFVFLIRQMPRQGAHRNGAAFAVCAALKPIASWFEGPFGIRQLDIRVVICVVKVDVAFLLIKHVCMEEYILVVHVLRCLLKRMIRCHTILLVQCVNWHIGLNYLILNVPKALVSTKFARQARPLPFMVLNLTVGKERRYGVSDEDRPVSCVLSFRLDYFRDQISIILIVIVI